MPKGICKSCKKDTVLTHVYCIIKCNRCNSLFINLDTVPPHICKKRKQIKLNQQRMTEYPPIPFIFPTK